MLHPLIFSAKTFPVRYWPKDAGAEQSITLRLKSAVVNCFGLGHLTMRPAPDFLRRGQADADCIEISNRICHFKGARSIQGVPPLSCDVSPPLAAPGSSGQWSVTSGQSFLAAERPGAPRSEPFLKDPDLNQPVVARGVELATSH